MIVLKHCFRFVHFLEYHLTLETIVPIKIELSTMDFEPRISGIGRDQDANCARPLTYFQLDPTNSKCCFKNESF